MCGYLLIYTKSLYFLSLIDHVAPLIDIIIKMFVDIRWFMLVMAIGAFTFVQAFMIMGEN